MTFKLVHEHEQARLPQRVVILGANGFLGRALQQRIASRRVAIVAVGSEDCDLASPRAESVLSGILRPSDVVIVLAALKPGRQIDEEAFQANLAIVTAICAAVKKNGCGQLIYVSSDAVYPYASSPIRESDTPYPDTLYGKMHLARERSLQVLDGPPVAILRLTQVYGPNDPHHAYGPNRMLTTAITERRIVLYGEGEETRDHIYIDDVADVIFDTIVRRSHGLLNVATGHSISFASLAERTRTVCGGTIEILHEARRAPVKHRKFDTTALHEAFPQRCFTPLDSGLTITACHIAGSGAANWHAQHQH